ncbi:MAG TPA: thioesterase family protein [Desulfobacterales bacterium]
MVDPPNDLTGQLQILKSMYESKILFNRILGFKVESVEGETVYVRFAMKPELIGNYVLETLHGGVISAVLDATGGLNVSVSLLQKLQGQPAAEIEQRMTRIGTIDLRIDYLRPGRGRSFRATSDIMRTGKKVAVTRMQLHNDEDKLIAVGTGTYIVG